MHRLMALAALVAMTGAAEAHTLQCPTVAPPSLPRPGAAFTGAEILSYAPGERVDPASPPSLAPDAGSTWDLTAYGDAEVQELWCQYRGNPRDALRMGPAHVRRCAIAAPARTAGPRREPAAWCD